MFHLFSRDKPCAGSVHFRGNLPARPEEFSFLRQMGIDVAPGVERSGEKQWSLHLKHPTWGKAELVCLKDMPAPPREWIDVAFNLSDEEKHTAKQGGPGVTVVVEASLKNVLRDRKNLLRFMGAVMGDDGVIASDHSSTLFWSRASINDELSHDADLDIESLYCIHAVRADGEEDRCDWLHTHGLGELGAFDFDILRPSPSILQGATDAIRAIAFAIVEGEIKPDTSVFQLARPGGEVRFVPVAEFHRTASTAEAALRTNDASHSNNRSVLCEPGGGFLGVFGKSARISKWLTRPLDENCVFPFSTAASLLMSERARKTLAVFGAMSAELREFEFPAAVKIGYQVDGGGPTDQEHLWFEVHEIKGDSIDATLLNQPHAIDRMKQGDRASHPIERLSDWIIMTPAGSISPRNMTPIRRIREHKDELRNMMKNNKTE